MAPCRSAFATIALAVALATAAGCTNDYDRFSIGSGGGDQTATSAATTSGSGGSGGTNATVGTGGAASTTGTGGAGGANVTTGSGGQGGAGGGTVCVDVDGSCEPSWNTDWTLRRRIQIDTTGAAEDLTDFPALVRIDASRIDYSATLAGGDDVRFIAEGGATVLDRDVEAWNPAGTSSIWLRIPTFPTQGGGPITVWMYYGNAGAPPPNNPKDAWSPDFTSVHHLNADFADASGNNHTGNATNLPVAQPGRIAGGMNFDGSNDRVELANEASYDYTTNMTVSAWIRVETFTKQWQAMITKGDSAWRVHRDNTNNKLGFGSTNLSGQGLETSGATVLPFNAWRHIAVTYDGALQVVYVDGQLDGSMALTSTMMANNYPVCFGENNQATGRHFDGDMDEVRISDLAMSASWIRLEHRTVTDAAMMTFSAEQVPP